MSFVVELSRVVQKSAWEPIKIIGFCFDITGIWISRGRRLGGFNGG